MSLAVEETRRPREGKLPRYPMRQRAGRLPTVKVGDRLRVEREVKGYGEGLAVTVDNEDHRVGIKRCKNPGVPTGFESTNNKSKEDEEGEEEEVVDGLLRSLTTQFCLQVTHVYLRNSRPGCLRY